MMTVAELHGKLKPCESMEDLLTSDVFSAFKYCHPKEALIPFLELAICFDPHINQPPVFSDVLSAHYVFWPRSSSWKEPDLIIILKTTDGSNIALNVEAKYMSGKHNAEVDDKESVEPDHLSGDQLVAQYTDLKNSAFTDEVLIRELRLAQRKYLFYVTAHYVPPLHDIEETKESLSKSPFGGDVDKFFWLSWRSAWSVCELRKGRQIPVLEDLRYLLEKKNLKQLSLWQEVGACESPVGFWIEERAFWRIVLPEGRLASPRYFWQSQ